MKKVEKIFKDGNETKMYVRSFQDEAQLECYDERKRKKLKRFAIWTSQELLTLCIIEVSTVFVAFIS